MAGPGPDFDACRALASSADSTSLLLLAERTSADGVPAEAVDAFVSAVYDANDFKTLSMRSLQRTREWTERLQSCLLAEAGCIEDKLRSAESSQHPAAYEHGRMLSRFLVDNHQQSGLLSSMGPSVVVAGVMQLVQVAIVQLAALHRRTRASVPRPDDDDHEARRHYEGVAVGRRLPPILKHEFYVSLGKELLGTAETCVPFEHVAAACFLLWTRLHLGHVEEVIRHQRFKAIIFGPRESPPVSLVDKVLDALFAFNGDVVLPQWQRRVYGMHGPFPVGYAFDEPLRGMLTPPCLCGIVGELLTSQGLAAVFVCDGPAVERAVQRHCVSIPALLSQCSLELPPSAIVGMVLYVILVELQERSLWQHAAADGAGQEQAFAFAHALLYPRGLSEGQLAARRSIETHFRQCCPGESATPCKRKGKRPRT